MTWRDVLFVHWSIDREKLREHLPAALALDTYDGDAWLGVVGFRMDLIRPRCSPIGVSFSELNLRTYVRPTETGPRRTGASSSSPAIRPRDTIEGAVLTRIPGSTFSPWRPTTDSA